MAEMTQTLASMRQSIQRKLHVRDASGPLVSAIDRALNDAYSRLVTSHEWVWTQAEGAMLTYGTLTESDGSTLTPAGAGYIRLDAADAAGIDAVGNGWVVKASAARRSIVSQGTGASDGQLTLALAWPDATPVTDYDLHCVAYNPSSLAIGKVYYVSVEDDGTETELKYKPTPDFQYEYINDLSTGVPECYTILRYSSLGNPMFAFGPIPDDTYQITLRYHRRPLQLSSDTDVPIVPPQWHYVIEEGALSDLAGSFLSDPIQAARHEATFLRALRLMQAESNGSTQVVHYFGGTPRTTDWDKVDPSV